MKKMRNLLLAVAVLAIAASCNKETGESVPARSGKVTVLTAHTDSDIEGKTSLIGVNVVWSADDAISAFDLEGENITSTNTEVGDGGSTAKFTIPGEDILYAIYPANESAEMDGSGAITTVLPTQQTATAGSFGNGANLAIAEATDIENIQFKNVGGLVAFKIKATMHNIVSAKLSGTEAYGGAMTGEIYLEIEDDNVTSLCGGENGENYVELTGSFSVGETYYAVVAPGTYSDVTLVFTDDEGKTATYTKTENLVVERNSNQLIGGFSPDSRWQENTGDYYVKVTSDEEIVAGSYLIVYETVNDDLDDVAQILSGVSNEIGSTGTALIITDGTTKKIAKADAEAYNIVVEEASTGTYTMKLDDSYLAYNLNYGTTKNNKLFLVKNATDTGAEWILSADGVQNAYNTERYLQYNSNNGNPRFACYKEGDSQIVSVCLYLLEGSGYSSGKQNVTMSFSPETVALTLGDTFTAPTLSTTPSGLAVSYASSNESVATVNEISGAVTILAAGTATITATFAGNDSYKSGTASYTITVNSAKDYIFYESFDKFSGTGGNDNKWNGQSASSSWGTTDNEGWQNEKGYSANKCAKFGTKSVKGSATTPALGITNETTATLTFRAGAWDGDTENLTLNISIEGNGQASVSSVTLAKGSFNDYTVILGNGIDKTTKVKFSAKEASINRFFLDEVKVVKGGDMPEIKTDPTLSVTTATLSWAATETDSKTITVTLNDDAAGYTVSPTTDSNWNISDNSGTITVSPKAANTSTSADKTLTITITHKDDSSLSKTVTCTQAKVSSGKTDPITLEFDLKKNPGSWPSSNGTTLTDYSYSLNGTNYTFKLKNVKQNSGYLMCTSTAVLGLPALSGYKLTSVVAHSSSTCSTSTSVGISSNSSSASYITGGQSQTWGKQDTDYTYTLTSTAAGTVYYLYVTNKNAQLTSLKLTYTPVN